jgi:hypothetical protein
MPVTIRSYVRGYGIVDLPEGHQLLEDGPDVNKEADWNLRAGTLIAFFCLVIIVETVIILYLIGKGC